MVICCTLRVNKETQTFFHYFKFLNQVNEISNALLKIRENWVSISILLYHLLRNSRQDPPQNGQKIPNGGQNFPNGGQNGQNGFNGGQLPPRRSTRPPRPTLPPVTKRSTTTSTTTSATDRIDSNNVKGKFILKLSNVK